MKAVITDGDGSIRLATDVPEPRLGPYDCRVRVEAFSFCNSTDSYIVNSQPPLTMKYPAMLGHESVGVVTDVGAKVRHFKVGDRVLRAYAEYPGRALDGYHVAWAGFAEFAKVGDVTAMREDGLQEEAHALRYLGYQQAVPPDLMHTEALMLIPWKEMHSALDGAGDARGRRFLVTGAGIVAFCFGHLLRRRGADHVTLVARRREPLDSAMRFGAADSVLLADRPTDATLPFDAMIETTGSIAFGVSQLGRVREGGDVYAYAIYREMGRSDAYAPFERSHRFQRIDPREAEAHEPVCALVRDRKLPCRELVTHEFGIRELQSAWNTLLERKTLKTVVHF